MGLRSDPLLDALVARCRFPEPGTAVSCAVSGGPDSLALLALAVHHGLAVTAIHVDHGLRPGSAGEAEVVAAAASEVGVAFRSEAVQVAPGPNLEARARAARYAVLPADVLTGHTLDDQAETMLLNLLRGAGPAGMAGMAPERRPLLAVRRSETAKLCHVLGWTPVDDPSNRDPSILRNRVRHELLPLLADLAGRDPAPVLAGQAGVFRQLEDLATALAGELDPTDARALAAAPTPVAAAALRSWLRGAGGGYPPDRAALERVLAVARGSVRATELAGGWRVARTGQRLRIVPPPTAADRAGRSRSAR
ncbi:MAG TPA: tRNA lysidine(34) synthetase TilS [Acidimicrobiales bacterium]|nr:tRNA lysidine(34) synthetase TilS [Acidimicrobiales bacterium]